MNLRFCLAKSYTLDLMKMKPSWQKELIHTQTKHQYKGLIHGSGSKGVAKGSNSVGKEVAVEKIKNIAERGFDPPTFEL